MTRAPQEKRQIDSESDFFRRVRSVACLCIVFSVLGACHTDVTWLAERGTTSAFVPRTPSHCQKGALRFEPSRRTLLGNRAKTTWHWAEENLPPGMRIRNRGRIALMPTQSPGVALQLRILSGRVGFIVLQSYATSSSRARPLTRGAVVAFLESATGCRRFELCKARATLDEVSFRGRTTCPNQRAPIQVVTPRLGAGVISVATWLPRSDTPEPVHTDE